MKTIRPSHVMWVLAATLGLVGSSCNRDGEDPVASGSELQAMNNYKKPSGSKLTVNKCVGEFKTDKYSGFIDAPLSLHDEIHNTLATLPKGLLDLAFHKAHVRIEVTADAKTKCKEYGAQGEVGLELPSDSDLTSCAVIVESGPGIDIIVALTTEAIQHSLPRRLWYVVIEGMAKSELKPAGFELEPKYDKEEKEALTTLALGFMLDGKAGAVDPSRMRDIFGDGIADVSNDEDALLSYWNSLPEKKRGIIGIALAAEVGDSIHCSNLTRADLQLTPNLCNAAVIELMEPLYKGLGVSLPANFACTGASKAQASAQGAALWGDGMGLFARLAERRAARADFGIFPFFKMAQGAAGDGILSGAAGGLFQTAAASRNAAAGAGGLGLFASLLKPAAKVGAAPALPGGGMMGIFGMLAPILLKMLIK